MSIAKFPASVLLACLFASCAGTVEDNAPIRGVSREEALDLKRAIETLHPRCKVYEYSRDVSGEIDVRADCGTWMAKRVHGKWRFTPTVITS